jgi:hypothetical protein
MRVVGKAHAASLDVELSTDEPATRRTTRPPVD